MALFDQLSRALDFAPFGLALTKPPAEELARATLQLATVDKLATELEFPINADDKQLLKVTLALDQYEVTGLFGRDGLHLNKLPVNCAV
jgi:hypothetical protein